MWFKPRWCIHPTKSCIHRKSSQSKSWKWFTSFHVKNDFQVLTLKMIIKDKYHYKLQNYFGIINHIMNYRKCFSKSWTYSPTPSPFIFRILKIDVACLISILHLTFFLNLHGIIWRSLIVKYTVAICEPRQQLVEVGKWTVDTIDTKSMVKDLKNYFR